MSLKRDRINLDSHHPEDLEKLSWDDLLYSLDSGGYGSDVMGDPEDEDFNAYLSSEDEEFSPYRNASYDFDDDELLNYKTAGLFKFIKDKYKLFTKKIEDQETKIDVKRLVKAKKIIFNDFRVELRELNDKFYAKKKSIYALAEDNLLKIKQYELQGRGKELPDDIKRLQKSLMDIKKIMGVLSKVMKETDETVARAASNPFQNTKSLLFYNDPQMSSETSSRES